MKATETNLLRFLQGLKQLVIPIYQRQYSWSLKECGQLWKDILRAAEDSKVRHFIGSVVYIESGIYQVSTVPKLHVIDGQQRITTISLLLAALRGALDEKKSVEITRQKINNYYLLNSEEQGDAKYKLILTQNDADTFISIVEGRALADPVSRNIQQNYDFFIEQIKKSKLSPEQIYAGVQNLLIVDISLDKNNDNPQLIFESLNATGLKLSQADLIRNFVLMGLDTGQQKELYHAYWHPMESIFEGTESAKLFDQFMRDYLTLKTGSIPNIAQVYDAFKEYAFTNGNHSEIVKDAYHFSKLFARFAFLKEQDVQLRQTLSNINALKVEVAYPFLLELFDDYEKKVVTHSELLEILKLLESYVFRRAICGIPTNSLNNTFATLGKEIDKTKYLESLKVNLLLKESYKRFPQDAEFSQLFAIKDVYNMRIRNYALAKLENHDRKELVDVEGYTIEHIMPQNENLSTAWQQELGANWKDIHAKYLHTIGNLTLTGYNSELSDRPFLDKRNQKGGFADSPIRLNHGLAKLEHWNEQEIKNRAQELAKLAGQIWTMPIITSEVLQTYSAKQEKIKEKYTLDFHENNLSEEMKQLFAHLRTHILNLSADIREVVVKHYVVYKFETNVVSIAFRKKELVLYINLPSAELLQTEEIMYRDLSNKGHLSTGDIELRVSTRADIEKAMKLVKRSFERQALELS